MDSTFTCHVSTSTSGSIPTSISPSSARKARPSSLPPSPAPVNPPSLSALPLGSGTQTTTTENPYPWILRSPGTPSANRYALLSNLHQPTARIFFLLPLLLGFLPTIPIRYDMIPDFYKNLNNSFISETIFFHFLLFGAANTSCLEFKFLSNRRKWFRPRK